MEEFELVSEQPPKQLEPKYAKLWIWLKSQPKWVNRRVVTFERLEEILGVKLPDAAYNQVWWCNNTDHHPQAVTWLAAGWKTKHVSPDRRMVTFYRNGGE